MSTKSLCVICGYPQDLSTNREILSFSPASICSICFRICLTEYSAMRKAASVVVQPTAPTATAPASLSMNAPALQQMIADLLKDMLAKKIKHARIYRNERGTIVVYRVQNAWQEAFQQTTAIHLPLLHQFKLLARIDPNNVELVQQGDLTLRTGNAIHQFHLHFHLSAENSPIIDITY